MTLKYAITGSKVVIGGKSTVLLTKCVQTVILE